MCLVVPRERARCDGSLDSILVNGLFEGPCFSCQSCLEIETSLVTAHSVPRPILAAHVIGTDEIFPWSGVSAQINVHPAGVRPIYISSLKEVVSCPCLVYPLWNFSTILTLQDIHKPQKRVVSLANWQDWWKEKVTHLYLEKAESSLYSDNG